MAALTKSRLAPIAWYRARRSHRRLAFVAHLRSIYGSTLLRGMIKGGIAPQEAQRLLGDELALWDEAWSRHPKW